MRSEGEFWRVSESREEGFWRVMRVRIEIEELKRQREDVRNGGF